VNAPIPAPRAILPDGRRVAAGWDLGRPGDLARFVRAAAERRGPWRAAPIVDGLEPGGRRLVDDGPHVGARPAPPPTACAPRTVFSPADRRRAIGEVLDADASTVAVAMRVALDAFPDWSRRDADARAAYLDAWADALEADVDELVARCVHEAGKTLADAIADVREAVDFCRFYAAEARRLFAAPMRLPGPTGERNELSLAGRGPFACIAPWNFPVAIFVGQAAAALAAGDVVLAKPAPQTPLAAHRTVELALRAGVPPGALALLPGGAEVGDALVGARGLAGVAFTGSNATAKRIQRRLADAHDAILPLIAETGGVNAMIVDSTALPEQVTDAVVASAFRSAGQRCSALRVLALQDEIADAQLAMIRDAMATLLPGDPADPATDLGPVIDAAARDALERHVEAMRAAGHAVERLPLPADCVHGHFVAPTIVTLDTIAQLPGERFGPILHVVRWPRDGLPALLREIAATGHGLTMGLHTRLDARIELVRREARVGNLYVNRNIVGAVVGVQPFGGEGLSGTGPKAGGPWTLHRFATERCFTENTAAAGGDVALIAGASRG
jgi:RHH-type proline utilization regulon transcriptional repressor/proline dehydrogenase/delta 1-pyrroline-5-carboxylate dehydrogenase